MVLKIYIGILGLLIIGYEVEGTKPANCGSKPPMNQTEESCSCPAGETIYKLGMNGFYCFKQDQRCPNGYYDKSEDTCYCIRSEKRDRNGLCMKLCENCDNGWCASQSRCVCNSGFKISVEGKCEPDCVGGCENGHCGAGGKCLCNQGYYFSEANNCEPVCPNGCANGLCIAPNKCVCRDGYLRSRMHKCEPVCEGGCENGICEGPDKCSCNEGYKLSWNKKCKPITCKYGYQLEGNECKSLCPDGYSYAGGYCDPICDNCGGSCESPGLCMCNFWEAFFGLMYNCYGRGTGLYYP